MNTSNQRQPARLPVRLSYLAIAIFVAIIFRQNSEIGPTLHAPIQITTATEQCLQLRPRMFSHQDAVIREPGFYCVEVDFWQRILRGAGHTWPTSYHRILSVHASNVTIDLKNHTLRSDGASTGIGISLDKEQWDAARTITIKNGVIDLRGGGTGIEGHHKWQMFSITERVPGNLTGYDEPTLILENLLIKTANMGITLTGNGNVIRRCVIESGGNAAIIIAGPNSKIFDNVILLNAPFVPGSLQGASYTQLRHITEFFEAKAEPTAAIALHQATGTVIRNNRIEVRGKSATRHNIYLNNGSRDVLIEGNTFVSGGAPVTMANGSTSVLKNNVVTEPKAFWSTVFD